MKLSEAIRLGAMLKPQGEGAVLWDGRTCAYGAALDAAGQLSDAMTDGDHFNRAGALWPIGMVAAPSTPFEGMDGYSVGDVIIELNDEHHWTREQIADWVETIEAQQAPTAQPAPDVAEVIA